VRDSAAGGDWGRFSELLRESRPGNGGKLGLYLAMEEIIPVLPYRGIYRVDEQGQRVQAFDPATEVRAVVEARFLSMRAHAAAMGISRPTRIVATGGGSKNAEMMQVLADVFGVEVYRSDVSNSAAVGAALRAEHAVSCRRAGGWHEFDTAALASGLKLVASPSLNGAQAYDDKLVSRFAAFERAGHQSQVERKV
jgi:xylulokinase